MIRQASILILTLVLAGTSLSAQEREATEYQGQKLTPVDKQGLTTVESPPAVDLKTYRLRVDGAVTNPVSLAYDEVLALPGESRVVLMPCVEGWDFAALWTGIPLTDLLAKAGLKPGARTVIFHALGGEYTSSLPLDYVIKKRILLAYKDNDLTLSAPRGFPFKVVAEGKLGYKWVQWVERVEISDKDYAGFWESRGYSNEADAKK